MVSIEEQRFANLSRDAFFRLTYEEGLSWVNDGFLTLTCARREDLLGKPGAWERFFSKQGLKDVRAVRTLLEKDPDACIHLPLELLVCDDQRLWVEVTVTSTLDESGAVNGVQGYARDVSEHVRVAELLTRRTEEQRVLLQVHRDLLGELNLKETLDAIVGNALELLDATDATLFLLADDQKTLHPVASSGPYEDALLAFEMQIGEGITGNVVETGQPILLKHVLDDPQGKQVPDTPVEDESVICAPLLLHARSIGALLIGAPPEHFDEDDLHFLMGLAQVATLAVANSQLFSEVQHLAVVDDLTGTYNRNFFNQTIRTELNHARRMDYPLSVLMIDIDRLKPINDRFGHLAGDRLLVTAAQVLKRHLRDVDWVARIGGDEFAVVLPGCSLRMLPSVAEKLQSALREASYAPEDGQPTGIKVSIGGSTYPDIAASLEDILKTIDLAEMNAKQAGGNQAFIPSAPGLNE